MQTGRKMKTPKIFLSYATADRRLASAIAKGLTRAGFDVIDSFQLGDGAQWGASMRSALASSGLFVAFVSDSSHVLAELGAARAHNTPILGILPDRARMALDAPYRALSQWRLIDAAATTPSGMVRQIAEAARSPKLESA
jgi:hypothetical protein